MLLTRNSGRKGRKYFRIMIYGLRFIFFCHAIQESSRSRVPLWISHQDGQYRARSHAERVVQIAYDAEWGDAGQSGGDQHLRSVGYQPLHEARKGVQYARRLSAVKVETQGDVFGDRSGGDDGYCIVGSAEVGDADEGGYAEFRPRLPLTWRVRREMMKSMPPL